MTILTVADGFAYIHSRLDLSLAFTSELTERQPTSLRFALNGTTDLRLTGTNFFYDAGNHPIDGQVDTINGFTGDALAFTLTDTNLDLGDVFAADPAARASAARIAIFSGGDNVAGASLDDLFNVQGGPDVVMGAAGADTIYGGNGNDHLYGQSPNGGSDGADYINGEEGSDYIQGNAGDDDLDGERGSDRIQGGADKDFIFGGEGNDTLNGNKGDDFVDGWTGDDFLRGGQGNDRLTGGSGKNVVMGDLGNDTIDAQVGTDLLTGGGGSDRFVIGGNRGVASDPSGLTAITDFTHGDDRIEFRSGLGTRPDAVLTGTATSYQAATQQAQALMAGRAGDNEVAAIQVGSDTYLFYTPQLTSSVPTIAIVALDAVSTDFTLDDFVRF